MKDRQRSLTLAEKLGRLVKCLRLMRKLTQPMLSEKVGISARQINRIELGKRSTFFHFQAFLHTHGRIVPEKAAEFLILDHDFPRSILYCLTEAQQCLHDITGTRIGYFTNPAELSFL